VVPAKECPLKRRTPVSTKTARIAKMPAPEFAAISVVKQMADHSMHASGRKYGEPNTI
jgi:hypothetical protein